MATTPEGLTPMVLPGPLPGSLSTGPDTAVAPVHGHRPNEVLWWHRCPAQGGGWITTWLKHLQLTGLAYDGTLTVHGLIRCDECGRAGWIDDMTWTDTAHPKE